MSDSASITIDEFAKWLAWADRTGDIGNTARFKESAERYWSEHADPANKGRWRSLAAFLLGVEYVTDRDMRYAKGWLPRK